MFCDAEMFHAAIRAHSLQGGYKQQAVHTHKRSGGSLLLDPMPAFHMNRLAHHTQLSALTLAQLCIRALRHVQVLALATRRLVEPLQARWIAVLTANDGRAVVLALSLLEGTSFAKVSWARAAGFSISPTAWTSSSMTVGVVSRSCCSEEGTSKLTTVHFAVRV